MLRDPASGKVVGDSFDIANYLEDTFPDSGGCLFPPDSTGTGLDYESPNRHMMFYAVLSTNEGSKNEAYAQFNLDVDATFSAHMVLFGQYLPFNPDTADVRKGHLRQARTPELLGRYQSSGRGKKADHGGLQEALTSLAQLFMVHEAGPYLEGEQANYADLIVGGWLNMLFAIMPEEEWKDFRTWHGGVFARLHDALQENYFECN